MDLNIIKDTPLVPTQNGVYHIPKLMLKGKSAGTYSYERRENIVIYPLLISDEVVDITKDVSHDAIGEIADLAGTENGTTADITEEAKGIIDLAAGIPE